VVLQASCHSCSLSTVRRLNFSWRATAGTALAWHSFSAGVDAGNGLRELFRRHSQRRVERGQQPWAVQLEHYHCRWASLVLSVVLAVTFWVAAGVVFLLEPSSPRWRKISLGCLVGPFGCWLRWFLSFRNGKGLGEQQRWQWIPFGTLAANLIAVSLEAVTSSVDSVVSSLVLSQPWPCLFPEASLC